MKKWKEALGLIALMGIIMGSAACGSNSGCGQDNTSTVNLDNGFKGMDCGAGTHLSGTQCVKD